MYEPTSDYQYSERSSELAMRARRRRHNRNVDRALALEAAMFNWRSRHLILVLTMSYLPDHRWSVDFDTIRQDRDRFLNDIRYHPLLQPITGYAWKIEYGERIGGFHIHMVLFYDGAHRAHIHFAEVIGKYWETVVTGGRGKAWNHNRYKDEYARGAWGDATGQVNRNDLSKRHSLQTFLVRYLAKDEQHANGRPSPYCHTFGTSQFPI